MKYFLSLLFLGCFLVTFSQINFNIKVSPSHLEKVEKSKDARNKLKQYKKYYTKDSIKAAKAYWKGYVKAHKDSLKQAGKWKELKENKTAFIKGTWDVRKTQLRNRYAIDTALFSNPKDSLEYILQQLAKQGDFAQIDQLYQQYAHYDSAYLDDYKDRWEGVKKWKEEGDSLSWDSLNALGKEEVNKQLADYKVDSLKNLDINDALSDSTWLKRAEVKKAIEKYMPEDLKKERDENLLNGFKNGNLETDEFGHLRKVDKSGVKDFFQNVDPEEFGKAQLSMKTLKNKYASMKSLGDTATAIKKHSLEGVKFKKRIYVGGNVNVRSTDPIILDNNIQLGYWVNKKWLIGVGFILRKQLVRQDSTQASSTTGDAYGYSVFTRYNISKGFFAVVQVDRQKAASLFQSSAKQNKVKWEEAYLLGIGKEFSIGPARMNTTLLYDLNHANNTLNSSPFVMRVGVQFTRSPFF